MRTRSRTPSLSVQSELSSELRSKLFKIQAVPDGRTPASALLSNGMSLPRVVFAAEAYATDEMVPSRFVRAALIIEISESPHALPSDIRKRMFRTVETSMSSLEFVLIMKDQTRVPYWYSGPIDFVDLPEGYKREDIVDIEFGRGVASTAKLVFGQPEFACCVYR